MKNHRPQNYPNKFHLTPQQNRRFARTNLTNLVHTTAKLENVQTTLPQTQTIMDGVSAKGIPISDILTIINLKKGWEMVINEQAAPHKTSSQLLQLAKKINQIVAAEDALQPGQLRTGNSQVNLGEDTYQPPVITAAQINQTLQTTLKQTSSSTEQALTIMYLLIRQQWFWDGNKRTATLLANYLLINNGAGLLNVPLDHWETWQQLLSEYYLTNHLSPLKQWTYHHAITGPQL